MTEGLVVKLNFGQKKYRRDDSRGGKFWLSRDLV
jgi:hypothetical protein